MKSPDPTREPQGNSPGGQAEPGERVRQTGQEAMESAKAEGRDRLERGKHSAADTVASTSEALDEAAASLSTQGQESLARATSVLADKLSGLANELESRSIDQLSRDATRLARDNPGLFVAGSVALGVALSRFLKASARHPSGSTQQYGGPAYGTEGAVPTHAAQSAGVSTPGNPGGQP